MLNPFRSTLLPALIISALCFACSGPAEQPAAVVIQTDFGVKDGAVAAMKGVVHSVDAGLQVYDLTHEIPAYNVWEAAYRLNQVIAYWPKGTVFVSVVDPGVGTSRRSVVVRTKTGHYVVTPDNGTMTLVAEAAGVDEVRLIDERLNRREGSAASYTFHGRDVYAYTAARLAAGKISYEEVGPVSTEELVKMPYQKAALQGQLLKGNIPVLDIQYGNLWTNIPDSLVKKAGISVGDMVKVRIADKGLLIYEGVMPLENTFGKVPEGKPLGYFNSLMNFSIALNMGSFAEIHQIQSGPDWNVEMSKK